LGTVVVVDTVVVCLVLGVVVVGIGCGWSGWYWELLLLVLGAVVQLISVVFRSDIGSICSVDLFSLLCIYVWNSKYIRQLI